jgi:hypothetical protein
VKSFISPSFSCLTELPDPLPDDRVRWPLDVLPDPEFDDPERDELVELVELPLLDPFFGPDRLVVAPLRLLLVLRALEERPAVLFPEELFEELPLLELPLVRLLEPLPLREFDLAMFICV